MAISAVLGRRCVIVKFGAETLVVFSMLTSDHIELNMLY